MAGMSESVSFDRAAGYYDRTRALPDSLMARVMPLLLAEIPQDGRCLEIGIGTGRIALPLAGGGGAMVGIDISREMLRPLIANARRSAPRVLIADATQLPFAGDTFSSAVAAHVFHLIPSWKVAVSELLRVVRPGGIILASRGNRSRAGWTREVSRHFFVEAGDPPWPPGADRIEEVDEHMRSRGAEMHALPELATEREVSLDTVIANLEAGYFSGCWSLDESTRKKAAAATRAWAAAELGDLAELRTTSESSAWHAYAVP